MEDSTASVGNHFWCWSTLMVKIFSIHPERTFLVASCDHCPLAFLCAPHLLISSLLYLNIFIYKLVCMYIYVYILNYIYILLVYSVLNVCSVFISTLHFLFLYHLYTK